MSINRVHVICTLHFLIDGKWTVAVGGKNKGFDQITDVSNSLIAADGIEIGAGNKIPLWLFGLVY